MTLRHVDNTQRHSSTRFDAEHTEMCLALQRMNAAPEPEVLHCTKMCFSLLAFERLIC